MIGYIGRRLVGAAALAFGVATLVFFVIHLAPGDPVGVFAGPGVSPQTLEQIRLRYGLDQPLPVQYFNWLGNLFTGNFGISIAQSRPVIDILTEALPHTLLLSISALILAFVTGVSIGVFQAVRHGSKIDSLLSVASLFFYSMPAFWLAIMMMLVFALILPGWGFPITLPVSGVQDPRLVDPTIWELLMDRARHLVLPAVTLVLVLAAGISRYARSSFLEVLQQDFVRTARAKGLSERRVMVRHVFPNALTSLVTLLGLYFPILFTGTVLVEWVFAWPGLGQRIVEAILDKDIPLVIAGTFVFTIFVIVGNLIADILYALVDPRVRVADSGR